MERNEGGTCEQRLGLFQSRFDLGFPDYVEWFQGFNANLAGVRRFRFADPSHFVTGPTVLALQEDHLSDLFDSRQGGDASAVSRDLISAAGLRLKTSDVRIDLYGNGDVEAMLIATSVKKQGF